MQLVPALGAGSRPTISIGRVVVSIATLVVALVTVGILADWPLLAPALRELGGRPYLLLVLVIVYSAAFLLRALAWKALMVTGANTFNLFGALQTALLVNHLAPLKLGEFVRPLLAARSGVPLAEAATTTAVARVLDFAALLAIAAGVGTFASLSVGEGRWLQGLALPAAVIVGICGVLLALRWRRLHAWLPEILRFRFDILQAQIRQVSGRRVAVAAAWTLPSWILEAVVIIVAARALGIELSLAAAISITAFTILFQAFHITPGGIGVYEAVMTGALFAHGIPWEQGLALAVATHGLKFAYSYSVALAFSLITIGKLSTLNPLNRLRGSSDGARSASSFEVFAARLWNVLNEGKPFTPVFTLGIIALLSVPHLGDGNYWLRAAGALLALAPLFVVFYRFDFPLRLRVALWVYLGVYLAAFRFVDLTAIALIMGLYLTFTIFLWGTVYYHLRIGTSWLNFTRFWRLVLENPDPTSGNFLEQIPKLALLVLAFQMLADRPTLGTYLAVEGFVLLLAIIALLLHQWFFTWPPAPSMVPTSKRATNGERISRRFITIVIDGCRADRLLEANTPFIDRLRREGTDYTNTSTVYPARTVTGFSSMFTGAPPTVHGMSSNFVPSLGVKCDSIFDALRSAGLTGKLVGIAHLIDAFGHDDVETVTAVTNNDEIDDALTARAQSVIQRDDPDLLILQLLSVDQTGHARGSYNSEYLAKIEESDRIIQRFLEWCDSAGYLDEATVIITADHGQGIGIGGHGHMSPTERYVPCILWGHGVETRGAIDETHSVMDVTATIAYFLGVPPPEQSVGQVLGIADSEEVLSSRPVAVIIPAYNEAENLPETLGRIPWQRVPNLKVIVVDDGSTDSTASVAQDHGADVVISHSRNRGLGAALRTGLAAANELDARAAVYLDADGEYPPEQIPDLLEPVLQGEVDYVLGSRYLGKREGQRTVRLLGNLAFTGLLCLATGRRITDGQTGFRAFSRRALECAEIIHDYNYAQVLTLDLLKKGMRMREVPITYSRRTRGKSFIGPKYLWRVPKGMLQEMLSK
ncbi:MAG: lysylphosphatidylglycerol synthase domain-containing protein [Chloroflexota bacterium]|nr:lysylphosphatidylglycerol synthase domain-containing protein [Chloroflexota bacterium]